MKRIIFSIAAVLAFAGLAMAAEPAAPAKAPAPEAAAAAPAAAPAQNFEQRKARALKGIEAAEKRLKDAKACIEAAKDQDAMRACRPKGKPGKHPRKGMRQGGVQQPPAEQPQAK